MEFEEEEYWLDVRLLHVASTSVHPPTAHRTTASVQRPVQIVTAILNLVLYSRLFSRLRHMYTLTLLVDVITPALYPALNVWDISKTDNKVLLSILCILFVVVLCETEREQDEVTCLTF